MAGRILSVTPEPIPETRFRYETEKVTNWIYCDKEKKILPEVKINFDAYRKPMVFVACLMQDMDGDFPHVHRLATTCPNGHLDVDAHCFRRDINGAVDPFSMKIGVKVLATKKNKGNRSVEERDFANRCSFLKIDETAAKATLVELNPSRVRLCFRLYDGEKWCREIAHVVSEVQFTITDSHATEEFNYEIQNFQPVCRPAHGGEDRELIVVCGKVTKDDAMLCFRDLQKSDWKYDFIPDGTSCKLIGNHTFVLSDVPPYHDDSGGRVKIFVQHIEPPKRNPKETVLSKEFAYTSVRNVSSSKPQQQQQQQQHPKASSQQPIPTASSSVRSRNPVAPASNQRVKIQTQPELPQQQLQPQPNGGGAVRTRSMISSSSLGSGNPAPRKKALNEVTSKSEHRPFPSEAAALRLPETGPLNWTQEWHQSNDAYSQGICDFSSSATATVAQLQSSVQETGEAGECHNTNELDEKLARFYEEISTSTAQYQQPQYQQYHIPSDSVDGAENNGNTESGGNGEGGGSAIESMSDILSDLSLGLTEDAKKELDQIELVDVDK